MKLSKKSLIWWKWGFGLIIIIVLLYIIIFNNLIREDFYKSTNKKCEGETPVLKDGKCVPCSSISEKKPKWDLDKKKCVSCSYPTPYWNSDNGFCDVCPDDTPYWNKKICKKCEGDTPVWNYNKKICEPCPSYHPYFNLESGECGVCPDDTPYWNSKKCDVCPRETPYWNSKILECVSCPKNTFSWDKENNECIIANTEEQCQKLDPKFRTLYWINDECVIGDIYCDQYDQLYVEGTCVEHNNDNCDKKCLQYPMGFHVAWESKDNIPDLQYGFDKSTQVCYGTKERPTNPKNKYCESRETAGGY